jgi:hypothetical protein
MTTFRTSRDIPAPPDQVFAGDPQRLARWWGPAGLTNTFNVYEFKSITLAPSTGGTTISWAQAFESADVASRIEHVVVPAMSRTLIAYRRRYCARRAAANNRRWRGSHERVATIKCEACAAIPGRSRWSEHNGRQDVRRQAGRCEGGQIAQGVVLIIAPGARVLAVLWLVGSVALVAGILMIALGFRLKGMKDTVVRRPAYGR